MRKTEPKELTAHSRQKEQPIVEALVLIVMYGADAYLFRRWFPPFVSAIAAALAINLAFLPLFLRSGRWRIRDFFLFTLLAGLAIYTIGILRK